MLNIPEIEVSTEVMPDAQVVIVDTILSTIENLMLAKDSQNTFLSKEREHLLMCFIDHYSEQYIDMPVEEINKLANVALFLQAIAKIALHHQLINLRDKDWLYQTAYNYLNTHLHDLVQMVIRQAEVIHLNFNTKTEEYEVMSIN